jgi:hypothetical protein
MRTVQRGRVAEGRKRGRETSYKAYSMDILKVAYHERLEVEVGDRSEDGDIEMWVPMFRAEVAKERASHHISFVNYAQLNTQYSLIILSQLYATRAPTTR